jgi:hypothetical protein
MSGQVIKDWIVWRAAIYMLLGMAAMAIAEEEHTLTQYRGFRWKWLVIGWELRFIVLSVATGVVGAELAPARWYEVAFNVLDKYAGNYHPPFLLTIGLFCASLAAIVYDFVKYIWPCVRVAARWRA